MNANDKDNNKNSAEYYKYYETEEYKKNYAEHQIKQEQALIDMRLESSMGTQTEALKKPTYKELSRQQFIAIITAQLETNNHDGYCSDEDCKYTRKIVKAIIVVPEQYKTRPLGKITNTREYKWANHLQIPEVNVQGSGYCKFEKPDGGLGQHEYRYTIKKVEIVENKKYKNVEVKKVPIKETAPFKKTVTIKEKERVNPMICYDRYENQSRRITNINTAYCPDYYDDSQGRQCRGW